MASHTERGVGRDIVNARSQVGRCGRSHAVDGYIRGQSVMVEIDDRRIIGARVALRTAGVGARAGMREGNGI